MALPDQNIGAQPSVDLNLPVVEKEVSAQFAPIAIAELGLNFKPNQNPVQNSTAVDLDNISTLYQAKQDPVSLALPFDPKALREKRYTVWQETGYIATATGGEDRNHPKGEAEPMNWTLFETNPAQARKLLTERYKQEQPTWDEVKIARRVAHGELMQKIDQHHKLYKQFGESDDRVKALEEDINFWRLVFQGF